MNIPMHNDSKKKKAEILCVGTELLLGNILNSNAQWLSLQLASLGINHYRQSVIGDNTKRLQDAVIEASNRCEILIITGGLGPTPDDITTEAIANAFDTPLEEKSKLWQEIKEKISLNKSSIALSNRKQALLPVGAEVIPNPTGTAPGIIWSPISNFTILTFPGVPSELKEMWKDSAIPWIKRHGGTGSVFISKILHFTGISESSLAEQIPFLLQQENPTVATYASLGEVKIRITAQSNTAKEAEEILLPTEQQLKKTFGNYFYGTNEDNLASVVINLLRKKKETLAIAESCTGGYLGKEITAIAGSSDVFLGGIIAYSNEVKRQLLHIPSELLLKYGAVSEQVVEKMALNTREKLGSNWAISISGLAGPGGSAQDKPIGLVHIAIAGPNGCKLIQERFGQHRGRLGIQKLSVLRSLNELRILLHEQS